MNEKNDHKNASIDEYQCISDWLKQKKCNSSINKLTCKCDVLEKLDSTL